MPSDAFCGKMDEFEHLVERADLLIIHAGAGSVIHAAHAGKVPVVIPRRQELGEHVDNHQLEFVQELEKTGKIVAVYDCGQLLQAIADAQSRQSEMNVNEHKAGWFILFKIY